MVYEPACGWETSTTEQVQIPSDDWHDLSAFADASVDSPCLTPSHDWPIPAKQFSEKPSVTPSISSIWKVPFARNFT